MTPFSSRSAASSAFCASLIACSYTLMSLRSFWIFALRMCAQLITSCGGRIKVQKVVIDARGAKLEGDLYSSESNPSDKVLYYIHGGGFWEGSTKKAIRFVSYAAKHWGYNVFSVDYRLCPQYKCADTLSDCEAGYRHLLKTYAPGNIILIGESAGGNY